MKPVRLMIVLGVVWLILMLGLRSLLAPDPLHRTPEFLMDMANSPAFEAQEPNPNFADGRNLREPVAGTVARGFMPLPYGDSEEDGKRAGEDLVNPFAYDSPEVLARGEHVFETICAACHGPGGLGDGVVTKRGVPPPPSLKAEHAMEMKDGEIYQIITRGRKNMPPHAAQLARDDRWKVIRHIRQLQGAGK